jgi:hypothetical protein
MSSRQEDIATAQGTTPAAPHVCDACDRPFVVPISVVDIIDGGRRCIVELACNNCGRAALTVHDDAELEALDRELDESVAQMHRALDVLAVVDELERIDGFAAALRDDLILPEDF